MFSSLPIWAIWLILCGIFFIIEIFTVTFMMFWPGVAAFIVALLSLLDIPVAAQITIFCVLSIVLIVFTKPLTKKLFKSNDVSTNIDSIIGKTGIVTKTINNIEGKGQVKVQGEIWTAISTNDEIIEEKTNIKVISVDGVKLKVQKI